MTVDTTRALWSLAHPVRVPQRTAAEAEHGHWHGVGPARHQRVLWQQDGRHSRSLVHAGIC